MSLSCVHLYTSLCTYPNMYNEEKWLKRKETILFVLILQHESIIQQEQNKGMHKEIKIVLPNYLI